MTKLENAKKEFNTLWHPYFKYEEMECGCGECIIPVDDPVFRNFMFRIVKLRGELDFPFIVTSGYRCPKYNTAVSSTGADGPHTKGAMDIAVTFEQMYRLVEIATSYNMGVGIKQHGPLDKRFCHIDNLGSRLWSYP